MPNHFRIPRKHNTVAGVHYGTPKEVWGFRLAPARGTATQIARDFLKANADLLGLKGVQLRAPRHIQSLSAEHVIFPQFVAGRRIHRGYVTVHLDGRRRVYLVKNRAVPTTVSRQATEGFDIGLAKAREIARRLLRGKQAQLTIIDASEYWFPQGARLLPAYRVRVHRKTPRSRSEEILFIHARTGHVLSRYDNLATASVRARLFVPTPLSRVPKWQDLALPPRRNSGNVRVAAEPPHAAYRTVTLRDVPASHRLDGPRASTRLTRNRVRLAEPFAQASSRPAFEEVMAWFHVDQGIRYVESLGYRGARRIFREPLGINARGTTEDNSWYSPGIRSLTFGTGGIDDAEDAETITHEFGHALQDAICPGFGQSAEAAAMGEGFGDYLAGSTFAARKPAAFHDLVMSWDAFESSEDEPPRLRVLNSPQTYETFDHAAGADEHDNGLIWSATLWEIWNALGKAVADRLIIESHFQLDGFTTFARGGRAILDADRNLYNGRHLKVLASVFHRRGIGPIE
jgi:fungalysin metallopeptidase (M36)